jgi:hypothetical protein
MRIEHEDAPQCRQHGREPAGVCEVMAHLGGHGPIVRNQPGTAAGPDSRAMACSLTGRLISAANTPSAIAMYQTMS